MGHCYTKTTVSEQEVMEIVDSQPRLLGSPRPRGSGGPSKDKKVKSERVKDGRVSKDGTVSRDMFIIERSRSGSPIEQHYSIDEAIGEGAFGLVSVASNKTTGSRRAVKKMVKANAKSVMNFKKEIQIMKLMDHPGIVKLYETFEDQKNIFLVMEVCEGGELFDKIMQEKSFTERQAAILMQQAIRAVRHMHEHRVCHRDLKPENFLFLNKDPIETNVLKIIDFGLSARFQHGKFLQTKAGTPYYVAPEVLTGRYTQAVDLWSCGVIMYVLLCGKPPFYGRNDDEVLKQVVRANVQFRSRDWKKVSGGAEQLIRNLLKKDPQARYTAEQALNDEWIKFRAPKADPVSLQADILEHLRGFQAASHLKKAALTVIAGRLSEEQLCELRRTFVAMDLNGDGLLSMCEMRAGLAKAGLSDLPQDFQKLMDDVDADGSGRIDYTEFLAAMLDKRLYLQEGLLREAFNVFDLNNDGQIAPDELKRVLYDGRVQEAVSSRKVEEILLEVDNNGDGTIDFEEFMNMMHQNLSPSHMSDNGLKFI
mmetsp:Transcript_38741/g.72671  ORF Transcript_38741/g.72671 Transcript_38741/m.72671 type:complete len:536 (-) Transcript_38741:173-1780(-)